MLTFLFAVAAVAAQTRLDITAIRPLHDIATQHESAGYSRDEQFEYLATDGGLFRAKRLADGPLEPLPAAGTRTHTVVAREGNLFVLKGRVSDAEWDQSTLLRSRDKGVTFESLAEGLLDCSLAPRYPCGYLVPHQISFASGRIFLEATGNVLVTANEGRTWSSLFPRVRSGPPAAMVCPVVYERIGTTMLVGGECPLDFSYLLSGTLTDDLLNWTSDPNTPGAPRVITPALQNRNVQFIRDFGDDVVFAGVEGGLLKSTDGGMSFKFVIHHPLSPSHRYPYVGYMVRSSKRPSFMVAAGFDKKNSHAYLAYSNDHGESWTDATPLVTGSRYISLLAEDADGRLLVGSYRAGRFQLSEIITEDTQTGRKRGVVR